MKKSQLNKILAQNIKNKRLKLQLSQEKLSEELSLHRNTIFLLEAGKRGISLEILENLANFFNCHPHELLKKDDISYKYSLHKKNIPASFNASISSEHNQAYLTDGIKTITQNDINNTLLYAANIERAREAILIHERFEEIPQRFVNCLDSKTYVRPHMHTAVNQWELMCWLAGEIIALIFDKDGLVTQKILMNHNNVKLIEIPPLCYHAFVAVGSGAYLEIRNCSYNPAIDRLYSPWSPPEDSNLAKEYLKRLANAAVGDILTFKST